MKNQNIYLAKLGLVLLISASYSQKILGSIVSENIYSVVKVALEEDPIKKPKVGKPPSSPVKSISPDGALNAAKERRLELTLFELTASIKRNRKLMLDARKNNEKYDQITKENIAIKKELTDIQEEQAINDKLSEDGKVRDEYLNSRIDSLFAVVKMKDSAFEVQKQLAEMEHNRYKKSWREGMKESFRLSAELRAFQRPRIISMDKLPKNPELDICNSSNVDKDLIERIHFYSKTPTDTIELFKCKLFFTDKQGVPYELFKDLVLDEEKGELSKVIPIDWIREKKYDYEAKNSFFTFEIYMEDNENPYSLFVSHFTLFRDNEPCTKN
jgi:hypothetical protein